MKGCIFSLVMNSPCIHPRPAAIATTANTAKPDGHFFWVKKMESKIPTSAMMDPTDKSMPLVMMTMPAPMLKIPNMPINREMFCRFEETRKRGLIMATTAQSNINRMKIPSSFRMSK